MTSLNGDYIAIPPFKVTLKAYGKIVKVVQGNLAVIAGPTGLQVIGDNLKIPDENGLNLIEWAEVHFFIEGMKRTYQRKEYTGINLNGGLSAKINVLRATIPGSDSSSDTEEEVDKPSDGQAGKDNRMAPASCFISRITEKPFFAQKALDCGFSLSIPKRTRFRPVSFKYRHSS